MGSYMSTFSDDMGFWGMERSKKHRHSKRSMCRSPGRSMHEFEQIRGSGKKGKKSERIAFERGIAVGKAIERSSPSRFSARRSKKMSISNTMPIFSKKMNRRSPYTAKPYTCDMRPLLFGRRRSYATRTTNQKNAAEVMRLFQHMRKTHPKYTLRQAWKDYRRHHSHKKSHSFGLGRRYSKRNMSIHNEFPEEEMVEMPIRKRHSHMRKSPIHKLSLSLPHGPDDLHMRRKRSHRRLHRLSRHRFGFGDVPSGDLAFGEDGDEEYEVGEEVDDGNGNDFGSSPNQSNEFGSSSAQPSLTTSFGRPVSFGRPQLTM